VWRREDGGVAPLLTGSPRSGGPRSPCNTKEEEGWVRCGQFGQRPARGFSGEGTTLATVGVDKWHRGSSEWGVSCGQMAR
jgi:hypothetical protein